MSAQQGSLEFALNQFDLKRLRPWLPDNFRWQAVLSADGRASWRGNQPTLHATVRTTPGTFVADELKTDYQRLELGVDFERQQAAIRLDFASEQIGNIDTKLYIRDPSGRGNLSGQLKFDDLKLTTFAPLIPEVRSLQGVISADARFDGTLASPLLFGQLNLLDGEVQTHSDMVTLSKLVTRLKIEGNRAELDGTMLVGRGPLALGGWLSWAQLPVTGSLTIQGKELPSALPVPRQAVFQQDGRSIVYVRRLDGFEPQPVKVIAQSESRTAIEGIEEGTEVALINPSGTAQTPAAGGRAGAGTPTPAAAPAPAAPSSPGGNGGRR